jgi:hypothetical protein
MRGGSHGIKGSARPPSRLIAGEPTSASLSMIAMAASAVSCTSVTARGSRADAYWRTSGNGAPGLRPHYHANYYAAFVLDPDGNNIELSRGFIETPERTALLSGG